MGMEINVLIQVLLLKHGLTLYLFSVLSLQCSTTLYSMAKSLPTLSPLFPPHWFLSLLSLPCNKRFLCHRALICTSLYSKFSKPFSLFSVHLASIFCVTATGPLGERGRRHWYCLMHWGNICDHFL